MAETDKALTEEYYKGYVNAFVDLYNAGGELLDLSTTNLVMKILDVLEAYTSKYKIEANVKSALALFEKRADTLLNDMNKVFGGDKNEN